MHRIGCVFILLMCCATGCQTGCSRFGVGVGRWWSSTSFCRPNTFDLGMDNWKVRQSAKAMAHRSLRQFRRQSGFKPSCHFCEGFECAYIDMAQGGSGATPAIPPRRYWNCEYRSGEGYARADEWFEGYRIGAGMAEADGLKRFNSIHTSMGTAAGGGVPMIEP